ncbi:MAG: hypothetical protein K8F25_10795 [Fimbriimonadaceae bacterium]|nr:hypothetical protein [Alphaproteobacteria bacterium]
MSAGRHTRFNRGILIFAIPLAMVIAYFAYAGGPVSKELNRRDSDVTNTIQSEDGTDSRGPVQTGPSGLPLPRFVSLKSDRVNVRVGPSQDHAIAWVFKRQGLPIEIIAEFENWRQIRDSDGAEGWVIQSLLSGRRTVLIAPWSTNPQETIPLRDKADEKAGLIAHLEQNLLANLLECANNWCRISVQEIDGWLPQNLLWGVGPNESL